MSCARLKDVYCHVQKKKVIFGTKSGMSPSLLVLGYGMLFVSVNN